MSNARLGVFGGTFDPIHYGHLRLANEALYQFRLDRVLFIPAGRPPHKLGEPLTGRHDRWAMTLLAVNSHPKFDISAMEMERDGPSYTVDTLLELQAIYSAGADFYFIMGADAVLEMHTWKQPDRVLDLCQLVLSARPGFDLQSLKHVPVPGLMERAQVMQGPLMDVSSTQIRQRVLSNESICYMTPEPVVEYIRKTGLYTTGLVAPSAPLLAKGGCNAGDNRHEEKFVVNRE